MNNLITPASVIRNILTNDQVSTLIDFLSYETNIYVLSITGNGGNNGKNTLIRCIPNILEINCNIQTLRQMFDVNNRYNLSPIYDRADIFNINNELSQIEEMIEIIHKKYPNKLIIVVGNNNINLNIESELSIYINIVFTRNPNPQEINERFQINMDEYLNNQDFLKGVHKYLSNNYRNCN